VIDRGGFPGMADMYTCYLYDFDAFDYVTSQPRMYGDVERYLWYNDKCFDCEALLPSSTNGIATTPTTASATTSGTAPPAEPTANYPYCVRSWEVNPGDICDGIMDMVPVTFGQLLMLNPWLDDSCTNLEPGQILCLMVTDIDAGESDSDSASTPATTPTPTPLPQSELRVVQASTYEAVCSTTAGTTALARSWAGRPRRLD
jgi:hypothetical protein